MKILSINNFKYYTPSFGLNFTLNGQKATTSDVIDYIKLEEITSAKDTFIPQGKNILPAPDIYELYRIDPHTGKKINVKGEIYFRKTSSKQICYIKKPNGEHKLYSGIVGELTNEGTTETTYIEGYKRKVEEYNGRNLYRTIEYNPNNHSIESVEYQDGSISLKRKEIPNGAAVDFITKKGDTVRELRFKTATKKQTGSAYLKFSDGRKTYISIDYPNNYSYDAKNKQLKLMLEALVEAQNVLCEKGLKHEFAKNNYLSFQLHDLIKYLEDKTSTYQ